MPLDLILGTAGHIDHGKTSLVKALTGVDCDRLPEEKRRGITIDIGFAELMLGDYRLGIVDVPGHERFVRNMLAGATGMDLAMLVVAANDSVKPQTREHVEILRLLSLECGVIALTKADLVEPGWLELVTAEIRELVSGSFLEEAPIVPVSSVTGQGLKELRSALMQAAERAWNDRRRHLLEAPFRLPIDRAFTVAGHGTVVTGSVASGRCAVGDVLRIEPGAREVRIRGLRNHDRAVEKVHRGQRAAINLVGVHHDEITRGQELASPGHLAASRLITAQISLLPQATPLKNRDRVRVHVGTAEIAAGVVLVGRDRLSPGESAAVQLYLAQPAVTIWNQPLVIRRESPVATLGGGRVLSPNPERLRRTHSKAEEMLQALASAKAVERASAAVYFAGLKPWQPIDLARLAGVDAPLEVFSRLVEEGLVVEVSVSAARKVYVHRQVLAELGERVAAHLEALHAAEPLKLGFERTRLVSGFSWVGEEAILDWLFRDMQKQGRLRATTRGFALAGHGPKLSRNEQLLLEQLIERFRLAGLSPPSVKECQQEATKNQDRVPQLLALAAGSGELVEIAADFYLHAEQERRVREQLAPRLQEPAGLTVSQIREMLNTSRKYAIPLCEYLDRIGFTRRQGDVRTLNVVATANGPSTT